LSNEAWSAFEPFAFEVRHNDQILFSVLRRRQACRAVQSEGRKMLDLSTVRIAFLGFGNMASAMADGWIRSGAVKPEQLGAASRRQDVLEARTKARGMKAFATCEEAARWADVVVVAVKPHLVEGVVKPIRGILKDRLVLSVAVGRLFDFYESILESGTRHLSTLPNTPVSINEGIVICEARHSMTLDDEAFVEQLFAKLGLAEFADEKMMSAAGTLAGCGPAFAAMFIEALADGAVKHGVPRAAAYSLASQMLAGTAKLQLETGAHPGAMKDAVCSPGGTTIIGVAALERKGFRSAVIDAIDAIETRSR
jgi:pyrroline-5-carboxylate reductase